MIWDLTMAFGLLSAYGSLGEDPSWKSCHNQETGIDLDGNSTSHRDTAALHFIWKPDAKDYNQHFITNCSQLEENNYFWWKSVWKDCPVKQEGCFAFIALKLW